MVYNPATDYLALWRNNGSNVSKLEMPGLDFVVAALARAGIINLTVSATAPVANQSTTAWLKAAVPSYSAEGALFLWDGVNTVYAAATPALFLDFLDACAGQNGVSWWVSTGGPPANTVGNNGDFAIRTDEPGGVYGPKAAGAWPANAVPGTVDVITSITLDETFGTAEGQIIYRGPSVWEALAIGSAENFLTSAGGIPTWSDLSDMLDLIFGTVQGTIFFRSSAAWEALAPSAISGQVLSSGGIGADILWSPRTAEFTSGTVMLFQQSAAPVGWTKITTYNDYGLRVTSGAVGASAGTAFSTVFAQTAVGNTTITTGMMPSHIHGVGGAGPSPLYGGTGTGVGGGGAFGVNNTFTIQSAGSDGPHSHSVELDLSYVDVIIASKN